MMKLIVDWYVRSHVPMVGDAIGCQGQSLQNFTKAWLNIPEIAKERL